MDVMEFKVGDSNSLRIFYLFFFPFFFFFSLGMFWLSSLNCVLTNTLHLHAFFFLLQDHVCELLNTIDACQVFFDIVSGGGGVLQVKSCDPHFLLARDDYTWLRDAKLSYCCNLEVFLEARALKFILFLFILQ